MRMLRSSPDEAEGDLAALHSPAGDGGDGGDGEAGAEAAAPPSGVRGLCAPGARAQFGIGCALMLTQQFSGINAARGHLLITL